MRTLFENPKVEEVDLDWQLALTDVYGNTKDDKVMQIKFTKQLVSKINWENFLFQNVPTVSKGSPQNYVLSKEKLIQMPYSIYWGMQKEDPSKFIGKNVDIEKYIVKNHPLDNWKSGEMKSKGQTELNVYVVDNQVIGGTSFPVIEGKLALLGGYWSLDGKSLEEVQSKDFQTWRNEWQKKFEQ
jgi:hypothetical protein